MGDGHVGRAVAIYVPGGVSGARINPAVTLAFAVRRRFPWCKVAPYTAAQLIGAFAGRALVYAVYHDAISALDQAITGPKTNGRTLAALSMFATFPAPSGCTRPVTTAGTE